MYTRVSERKQVRNGENLSNLHGPVTKGYNSTVAFVQDIRVVFPNKDLFCILTVYSYLGLNSV